MSYKYYYNLVADSMHGGKTARNPTEQTLDAALREAYEKGFSDGREAAARVCDEDARMEASYRALSTTSVLVRAAANIRALKSEAQ